VRVHCASVGAVAAACVLLAAYSSAGAQVFTDDFERPNGPIGGWTAGSGSWAIDAGRAHAGPAAAGQEQNLYIGVPPTDFPVGDYSFSVDLSFLTADQQPVGRHAGVLFCLDEPIDRSLASGYYVWWIDRNSDRGINLERRDNGVHTKLVSGALGPDQGPPAGLRVEVEGATIRVFADDFEVITYDDATYRGGHFGLWTWDGASQDLLYDNVRLEVTADPLVACFTIEPSRPLAGGNIVFDASCSQATGTIADYQWDFGDGATAAGATAAHTYDFADSYLVTLTVRDNGGTVEVLERMVSVSDTLLKPAFEDDFDQPPGEPEGWTVFPETCAGVCWDVTDDGKLHGVSAGEVHIWAGDPPGLIQGDVTIDFEVEFFNQPQDGVGRHAGVFFFAEEPISRWNTRSYNVWWIDRPQDFGLGLLRWDPAIVSLGHSVDSQPSLRHPPRRWTITVEGPRIRVYGDTILILEADDATHPREGYFGFWAYSNAQDVKFDKVSVRSGVFPPETAAVVPCARVTPPQAVAGEELNFDASCTQVPPGVTVTAYRWDFGDGGAAVGPMVMHTYAAGGSYTATLTVEHSGGAPVRLDVDVDVSGKAALPYFEDFTLPAGASPPGWTVTSGNWSVTDEGQLEVVAQGQEAHIWVGDPPILFNGDVTFEFEIEFLNHVGDQGGQVGKHAGVFFYSREPISRWSSASYDVWWIDRTQDFGLGLHRWPLAFLSPGTGPGGFPELTDPPAKWRVEVEGGAIRVYGDDTLYVDAVDATRRQGYFGFWAYSNDQRVRFDNLCIVEGPFSGSPDCAPHEVRPCFAAAPRPGRRGETVQFDASCTTAPEGDTVTAYRWDFGDGQSASGRQVEHIYALAGNYTVTLTVEHSAGAPVSRSSAFQVIQTASLPLFEDFGDPAGPEVPGWTVSSGEWSISDDGRLEVATSPNQEAHIWLGDPPILFEGDITFTFEIEFLNHNPAEDAVGKHAGVFFYSRDPTLRWATEAYDVWWIDRDQDFGLGLHRWPLVSLSPGTGVTFPELAEPPREWRVEVVGPAMRVFGDGALLVEDVVDETRRSGYFGFWAYLNNQRVRFDNLCIVRDPESECGGHQDGAGPFVRGDSNADGAHNIADASFTLNFLFLGGREPPCNAAADVNGDGNVNIADASFGLNFLFLGGREPPAPFPDCAVSVSPSDLVLTCLDPRGCAR
jgi:PKD repeat protein